LIRECPLHSGIIVVSTTSWPRIRANVSLVLPAIDLAVPGGYSEVQIP
jgi:hypothetical protein